MFSFVSVLGSPLRCRPVSGKRMYVSVSAVECTWKCWAAGCCAGRRLVMLRPVGPKRKNANGDVPLGCAAKPGQSAALAGNVWALAQLRAEAESGRYNSRARYGWHVIASQLRGARKRSCAVHDVTPSSWTVWRLIPSDSEQRMLNAAKLKC